MKLLDIFKDREKMKHIIIYGVFGVLTTIVSFGTFSIFRNVFTNTNESILNIISIIIAMIFAYCTNRKYVFKSKQKNILKEFGLFAMSRAFSAIFEIVAFFILNELFKVDGLVTKVVVTFFVIVLNYFASEMLVFKKKNGENE